MKDSLFPEDMEDLVMDEEELEEDTASYLQGIQFDGDFVRDGKGVVKTASGIEEWKQWCINCLSTERYSSPLYSTDFGIETAEAFKAGTREEAETILASEITEAIMADPAERAEDVNEIDFEWGADFVTVYVNIEGADGSDIDVEVSLDKGR